MTNLVKHQNHKVKVTKHFEISHMKKKRYLKKFSGKGNLNFFGVGSCG